MLRCWDQKFQSNYAMDEALTIPPAALIVDIEHGS